MSYRPSRGGNPRKLAGLLPAHTKSTFKNLKLTAAACWYTYQHDAQVDPMIKNYPITQNFFTSGGD